MTPADLLIGHPLTARLSRVGQRVRRFDTAHRWVWDLAVVVLVILMFCVPSLVHRDDGPPELAVTFTALPLAGVLLVQAGLVLPLFWRRRAPFVAFHVVTAVFLIQWLLGAAVRADAALLVALYSLALHGDLRRLPWAGGILAVVFGVTTWRVSGVVSIWDVLFFLVTAATAAVAVGFAVRIRRAQLDTLRDRARRLEIERDQRSRLATATERTRVAREMHDIVGHSLSVIITLADGGSYAADLAPERGKEALNLIGDTGRRALAELRRVLGVLREETDPADLEPQPALADLDTLCERIRAAGPEVVYQSAGDVGTLDLGVQLTVYRIAQEALTNALKHAGPGTRVVLELSVDGGRVRILVRDTGPADASPAAPPPSGEAGQSGEAGHGLIGMRERAALFAGTVLAGPEPGGGWAVRVTLDLSPLDVSAQPGLEVSAS